MLGFRPGQRILVVAPFTHQNGHFVTFPRDVCCGLAASGHQVTLLHARPFAQELDWFGQDVLRICLKDLVASSPGWWRELWARMADRPSNQCLGWLIWKLRPFDYDLVLWTDFQAQGNVWPLRLASTLGLYRFRSAFFEHHPPEDGGGQRNVLTRFLDPVRLRVGRTPMIVFSKAHLDAWRSRLGHKGCLKQIPYGLWPDFHSQRARERARQELDLSDSETILLVFGVQATKRKHLDTLHEALVDFKPARPLTVIFAGRMLHGAMHPFSQWENTSIRVRIMDEFVPETLTRLLFAAADAVWANYRNFPGASGVLLQALGAGRVCIACTDGEIGSLCRQHKLGFQAEDGSPRAVHACLKDLLLLDHAAQLAWESRLQAIALQYSWIAIMTSLLTKLSTGSPSSGGAHPVDT